MNITRGDFYISDDKSLIQLGRVCEMLFDTYWASGRSREIIEKSIANSFCFGVYQASDNYQVGFCRCVTDYAVLYYLADVVVDSRYRGRGLGKALMGAVTEHELFRDLYGNLGTRDAQGLYSQFGFERGVEGSFMRRDGRL